MRRQFAILFALIVLAAASTARAANVNVDVRSDFYNTSSSVTGMGTPDTTINVGDTIVWTWFNSNHSVTSDTLVCGTALFDSGVHNTPFTFSYTFTTAGDYDYHCTIHGVCCNMKGIVHVLPASYVVTGAVALQGCMDLAQPLTFQFRPATGTTITQTVTLNSDGTYSAPGIPSGIYTVAIKGASWLQADIANVSVTNGNVTGVNATLLPGDINGDNVVDISDFSLLAQSFGLAASDDGFISAADLNCDGVVDISDFSLLASNFGQAGDP